MAKRARIALTRLTSRDCSPAKGCRSRSGCRSSPLFERRIAAILQLSPRSQPKKAGIKKLVETIGLGAPVLT
ncbi:hypothetical protein [Mesorhizobium temperatum]|uniref:hypothetical protein n=1 Tax=Mesorhizobium temperatum TaxID=241416 RepID=UPI00117E9439|nr:hypothetical protein [Mesorhizobium temperatum]